MIVCLLKKLNFLKNFNVNKKLNIVEIGPGMEEV